MSESVDIRPRDLAIIRDILKCTLPPSVRVWVFGSRAKGMGRRASDLDLAIDLGRPLSLDEHAALADAFSESDLPYKVDVLDRVTARPAFLTLISKDMVSLPLSN